MLLPSSHDTAHLIEVVRITDPARHLTSQDLAGTTVAIWEGDQVQEMWALIADLPGGDLQRCFLPGWGIRAHGPEEMLFEVAFCFRCHRARFWGPGGSGAQGAQTFDAGSPAAIELLRRFSMCQDS